MISRENQCEGNINTCKFYTQTTGNLDLYITRKNVTRSKCLDNKLNSKKKKKKKKSLRLSNKQINSGATNCENYMLRARHDNLFRNNMK